MQEFAWHRWHLFKIHAISSVETIGNAGHGCLGLQVCSNASLLHNPRTYSSIPNDVNTLLPTCPQLVTRHSQSHKLVRFRCYGGRERGSSRPTYRTPGACGHGLAKTRALTWPALANRSCWVGVFPPHPTETLKLCSAQLSSVQLPRFAAHGLQKKRTTEGTDLRAMQRAG